MITHLKGNITELSPTHLILDCNGIGYFLNISLNTFSKMSNINKESCKILTHLHKRGCSYIIWFF